MDSRHPRYSSRVPELPEVEVTRRRIAPLLVGRRIRSVCTTGRSYFFLTPPATVRRRLAGRTIVSLHRRGKYLLAGLDDGSRVVLHLGMTGQLFADGAASERLLSATGRAALSPEAQPTFRPFSDYLSHPDLERSTDIRSLGIAVRVPADLKPVPRKKPRRRLEPGC